MKNKIKIIEENRLLGGYSLAVRDDWSFKIKRVHINEKEKEEYIKTFGEDKMITYEEFFEWWSRINKVGKYSE